MSAGGRVRVLVVDDHQVVVAGLKAILGIQPDVEVVGEAGTGAEALRLFRKLQPDVTLLDLRLPDVSGTELIVALVRERRDARLIILSSYERAGDVRACLDAGAKGYLVKDILKDELVAAIRSVAAGKPYLSQGASTRLVEGTQTERLSAREQQVLELVAQGRSNHEIAVALRLSVGTVKNHVHVILTKLDVKDRAAAIALAMERGLVRPR